MLLENRVAVVSGIGPGMGRAIAGALAREGAHVVLAARSGDKLAAVAGELANAPGRTLCVPTDITDDASCAGLATAVADEFGRCDILVNNAYHPGTYSLIDECDLDEWKDPFEVNVLGSMRLTKALVPQLRRSENAAVVMINSMSMRKMMPRFGGYAASKAALLAATQTLALELGGDKIRVNSVVPGYIWGPALEGYFEAEADKHGVTPQQMYDGVAAETALGHIPTSAEIAETVVFFASDLSKVVTGQTLDVNGGHFFS